MSGRLVTGILLAAVAFARPVSAQDVVDGVVAVAGERPLMWSDVLFEAELRRIEESGGRLVNLEPTEPDRAVIEAVIERELILQEVGGEVLASEEAVNRRLEAFLDRFEEVEDLTRWLQRWRISTRELRAHFGEELRASTYAERRLSRAIRLADNEVREAFVRDPERWVGQSFAEVEETIRLELWDQRYHEQWRRWMDGIREKRGVRYTELGRGLFGGLP